MRDVLAVVVQHGEILLFLYVLADQLGVPIPAAPVLMAAGGLAAAGRLSLPGAIGLGVLATLVADLIWYAIGRSRGARVLGLLCRVSLEPDSCVRRTEEVFLRHGVRFLLFATFVLGLGTVGPPLAGMVGVGVLRFSLYSAIGAFFWAGAWMVLGYGAGQAVERVVTRAGQLGAAVAVTLGLVIVGYVVAKWIQRQRFLRSLRIARISPDELSGQLATGDKPLIVDLRSAVDVGLTPYALPGPSALPPRTSSKAGWSCLETATWCSTAADRTRRPAPGWRCCSSAEGSRGSVPWPADWKAGASADFRWNASSPSSPWPKTGDRTCGRPRGSAVPSRRGSGGQSRPPPRCTPPDNGIGRVITCPAL